MLDLNRAIIRNPDNNAIKLHCPNNIRIVSWEYTKHQFRRAMRKPKSRYSFYLGRAEKKDVNLFCQYHLGRLEHITTYMPEY